MTVTLKIDKTVYGGDGLGRLGDGRVAFVPGAYAGETVKAEIVEQKKRFVKTRLVNVEEAIPERLAETGPTVPGMVYADVAYAAEIRFKQDQLENFLWKVAHTVLPLDVIPAAVPLAYRNKVVYHTERQHGKWVLGYREEPDHRVVDVAQDPLACPAINAALPAIRSAVFTLLTQGARAVRQSAKAADNVTIRHTARDGVKWWLGEPPASLELCEQTAGLKFAVPADGFYQVNPQMADRLVAAVRDEYLSGIDVAPHVLDLYCGVGVFGLCCAQAAKASMPDGIRLVGIESGRAAVACAKKNAAALGIRELLLRARGRQPHAHQGGRAPHGDRGPAARWPRAERGAVARASARPAHPLRVVRPGHAHARPRRAHPHLRHRAREALRPLSAHRTL